MELLIGCGNQRKKLLRAPNGPQQWKNLVTLDIDPNAGADFEWDLERLPLPFEPNSFDEVHAYEVLEHTGRQGDFRFFFAQWSEFWRILKPGGCFCGTVPAPGSIWVWGDPGHTRHLPPSVFVFLNQAEYERQVGKTAMADYRHVYREDFVPHLVVEKEGTMHFVLEAVKPSRIAC